MTDDRRPRRLDLGVPQVVSVEALIGSMFCIALAAIFEADGWLVGAAVALIVDALLERVRIGLRR